MDIMTHAKFHFNRLMLTLIFGIWTSKSPPRTWRTTEKAGPDRGNLLLFRNFTDDVSETLIFLELIDFNSSAILSGPSMVLNKLMAEATKSSK